MKKIVRKLGWGKSEVRIWPLLRLVVARQVKWPASFTPREPQAVGSSCRGAEDVPYEKDGCS